MGRRSNLESHIRSTPPVLKDDCRDGSLVVLGEVELGRLSGIEVEPFVTKDAS